MDTGYLYCFENESMPGILKIFCTNDQKLPKHNFWNPPTEYVLKTKKKIDKINETEEKLHTILKDCRIGDDNYFKISFESAEMLFSFIKESETKSKIRSHIVFEDKQKIRHNIKKSKIFTNSDEWVVIYDKAKDAFLHKINLYTSLSSLAKSHYMVLGKNRSVNGWDECEYMIGDIWVSTRDLWG